MAENNTDRTATSYSGSTQNPTPSPSTTFTCKKPIEEDEAAPESKRRKRCPTALDEFSPLSTPNNFSFTFDAKFTPCTPEFTPKFGSFNFVVVSEPDSVEDQLSSGFSREERVDVVNEFDKD